MRATGLIALFMLIAPIHIATKLLTRHSRWPTRFLASAAWLIGVRLRVEGEPVSAHSLLVANHTSWLDILVLGAGTGCAFVSKDSLGHPLMHWLADQNGTIYVKRAQRKDSREQAIALSKGLERDQPVAVFPEGTTGPGTYLLPFRSTLLEAAKYAARDVTIRPVAVDYHQNRASVGWYEEDGKTNVLRLLARRGTLRVTVRLGEALDRSSDRKSLTAQARDAIAQSLGLTSLDHSPIDLLE